MDPYETVSQDPSPAPAQGALVRHDHDDSWKFNVVQFGISRADRLSTPCHLHNNAFSVWRRCAACCDSAVWPSRPHNSAPQREDDYHKSINASFSQSRIAQMCSAMLVAIYTSNMDAGNNDLQRCMCFLNLLPNCLRLSQALL